MDAATPFSIRLIQTLAISGAAITAGANIGTTQASIPALLHSPSPLLAKQWQSLYSNGIVLVVPAVILSSASFAYLAYNSAKVVGWNGVQPRLYAAAAGLALGNAAFTRVFMWGVNGRLMQAASNGAAEKGVRELVAQWARLNLGRGVIALAAVVVGVWGIGEVS